jgi:hypothetical protein
MLAVLYALADQRHATATPLIHRLIHTPGPSAELLNLGPDTARGGPNTAREVLSRQPAARATSYAAGCPSQRARACDAISRV